MNHFKHLLGLVIFMVGLAWSPLKAAEAGVVVQAVLDKLAPNQYSAEMDFVNYRTDGTEQAYSISLLALNVLTLHLTFSAPRRDAGRQILNRDGEIWSYLPDSKKIVRLTDRDSIGNGDFNNADVLRLNWLADYKPEIVKETEKQIILDLNAKTNTATYFKIRLWVDKVSLQPLQQNFYDEGGHHMKTLKYQQVKSFSEVTRPSFLVMENVQTGQRTTLSYKNFQKEKNLPTTRFKQENLGK